MTTPHWTDAVALLVAVGAGLLGAVSGLQAAASVNRLDGLAVTTFLVGGVTLLAARSIPR
jgi:hypothetical protein